MDGKIKPQIVGTIFNAVSMQGSNDENHRVENMQQDTETCKLYGSIKFAA